ncbi:MAG: hypothetical protein ACE5RJ_02240 [Nitrosopumilaceae archaeon]
MREKSAIFLVLVVLIVIISGSFVFLKIQGEFVQVAKFIDSNMIAPQTDMNGAAILREGRSATITVDVEKLQDVNVDEIKIESYFTNSINGQYLLIDKKTINADFEKFQRLGSEQVGSGFEQLGIGATLGPTPIMITGVDGRVERFTDTLNVILYADDVEMDRLRYDIIIENSGMP